MKLVSIKDMKAQIFFKPNCVATLADALRSFELVANESDNLISQFPNDFRLYHLADFDTSTGEVTPLDPKDLGAAADFKRRPDAVLPFQNAN